MTLLTADGSRESCCASASDRHAAIRACLDRVPVDAEVLTTIVTDAPESSAVETSFEEV